MVFDESGVWTGPTGTEKYYVGVDFPKPRAQSSPPPGGKAAPPVAQPSQSNYDMTRVLTAVVRGGLAILFFRRN